MKFHYRDIYIYENIWTNGGGEGTVFWNFISTDYYDARWSLCRILYLQVFRIFPKIIGKTNFICYVGLFVECIISANISNFS